MQYGMRDDARARPRTSPGPNASANQPGCPITAAIIQASAITTAAISGTITQTDANNSIRHSKTNATATAARADRRTSTDERHASTDDRRTCGDDRRASGDDRRASGGDRRASADDRRASADDRRASTDDRRASTLHDRADPDGPRGR